MRASRKKRMRPVHLRLLARQGLPALDPQRRARRPAGRRRRQRGGSQRPHGKDRSVTAVYDRHGHDVEKREALCAWRRRVEEIVGGEASALELPSGRPTTSAADATERSLSGPSTKSERARAARRTFGFQRRHPGSKSSRTSPSSARIPRQSFSRVL
jgi:hypothetical protein